MGSSAFETLLATLAKFSQALWSYFRVFFSVELIKKLVNSVENDFSQDECSSSDNDDSEVKVESTFQSKTPIHGPTASEVISSLRIHAGTWNVAGKFPPKDLDLTQWLYLQEPADLYVIGFQEVVPLNAANVLGAEDRGPVLAWESLIRQALNGSYPTRAGNNKAGTDEELPLMSSIDNQGSSSGRYVRVASRQMVGLFLTIWIRRPLRQAVNNVKLCCVGCGLMGYLGNKGSIAVSLSIHRTTFCFVCSHLTSGGTEEDRLRRNFDVAEIIRRTSFGCPCPGAIIAHERIIWLGDLNYRLSTSSEETLEFVDKQDWDSLLKTDELRIEQSAGGVFERWQEGCIQFAPTYKYIPHSDEYVTMRSPAWCDRILWRGRGLKQVAYTRAECKISDHRPVNATLLAEVVAAA